MALVDLGAAELDIIGVVGDDLSVTFTITDNGSPYAWSGATVATSIATFGGTTQATNFTTANSVDGELILSLTDANTTTLGEGSYAWRVSVTKSSLTRTWVSGTLRLLPARMSGRTPSATTATLTLSTSATATLTITGGATGPTGGLDTAQSVNAQTGTSYTFVAGDAGKLVTLSNGSAITVYCPQDSDATIPVGTYIDMLTLDAGQVTVQAGAGATLRVSGLTAKSRAQYARFGVQKIAANTWSLFGDLASS